MLRMSRMIPYGCVSILTNKLKDQSLYASCKKVNSLLKLTYVLLFGLVPLIGAAAAASADLFFPLNSNPYGKSYSDWAIGWTKFAFERPTAQDPINDPRLPRTRVLDAQDGNSPSLVTESP
jgi:hypothetical protein